MAEAVFGRFAFSGGRNRTAGEFAVGLRGEDAGVVMRPCGGVRLLDNRADVDVRVRIEDRQVACRVPHGAEDE